MPAGPAGRTLVLIQRPPRPPACGCRRSLSKVKRVPFCPSRVVRVTAWEKTEGDMGYVEHRRQVA